MPIKKRAVETVKSEDVYFVVYEDDELAYFLNDETAWDLEKRREPGLPSELDIATAAEMTINKKTKKVIKSRWF